jgi:hypothetical protein
LWWATRSRWSGVPTRGGWARVEALREGLGGRASAPEPERGGGRLLRRLEGGRVEAVYFSASRTIYFVGAMEPVSSRLFGLRRIRRRRSGSTSRGARSRSRSWRRRCWSRDVSKLRLRDNGELEEAERLPRFCRRCGRGLRIRGGCWTMRLLHLVDSVSGADTTVKVGEGHLPEGGSGSEHPPDRGHV